MENKHNTGIMELDVILNNEEDIPRMIIDKVVFDATILPLMIDTNLEVSNVDRYEHIKTIWTNYYKDVTNNNPTGKLGTKDMPIFAPSHAIFLGMKIVDGYGKTVADTPPLARPPLLKDGTNIFLGYDREVKANPNIAASNLRSSLSFYEADGLADEWNAFLDTYDNILFEKYSVNNNEVDSITEG